MGQYSHPLGTVYTPMPSQGVRLCSDSVVRLRGRHIHGCQLPGFNQCRSEAESRLRHSEDAQLETGKVQQPFSHIDTFRLGVSDCPEEQDHTVSWPLLALLCQGGLPPHLYSTPRAWWSCETGIAVPLTAVHHLVGLPVFVLCVCICVGSMFMCVSTRTRPQIFSSIVVPCPPPPPTSLCFAFSRQGLDLD